VTSPPFGLRAASHAALFAVLLAMIAGCARDDRRIVDVGGGVALDRRTGLEWTSRDLEQALSWEDADRQCRARASEDGRQWRLPELAELEALYDPLVDAPCGERRCHLDPAIRLGGPYVWTLSARGPGTRFYFDFAYGNSFSPGTGPLLVRRVLCVRLGRRG
jgi:hypothetical protein